MGHAISMEQLKLDVGLMVEKMTQITIMFRRIKLRMEEYVCLKVYILLNKGELMKNRKVKAFIRIEFGMFLKKHSLNDFNFDTKVS